MRYPFSSYPIGWFAIGLEDEIKRSEVTTVTAFGEELIAFRDEAGAPQVLAAHCPHLGAHLGHGGTVVGDCVRCPFHGISFNGRGDARLPDGSPGQKTLKTRAWHARDVDGAVMIWFHPDGGEPAYEPVRYFDLRGEDGWTPMQWHTWRGLKAHPQETSENSVDLLHFSAVHGYEDVAIVDDLKASGPVEAADARVAEGPVLRIAYQMTRKLDSVGMPGQSAKSIFRVRVHGLGHSVVEVTTPMFNTEFRTYVLCTPINEHEVILRGGGTMKELPNAQMNEMVGGLFFKGFVDDVEQDFAIWENKAYMERPALIAGDGPVGAYRKWCRQFYA
ncbi:MAG: Rieske 2Fe-2S domain-containing protein [Myxococcota bacterium]